MTPTINFGKYKGATLNQLPLSYRFWLVTTLPQSLDRCPDFKQLLLDEEEAILEQMYNQWSAEEEMQP